MGHAFAGLWQQQYHYDRTRYHPDHRQQRQHGARDEFRIDLCVGIRSRRLAPHPSPNHRVHPTNRYDHATASTAPASPPPASPPPTSPPPASPPPASPPPASPPPTSLNSNITTWPASLSANVIKGQTTTLTLNLQKT